AMSDAATPSRHARVLPSPTSPATSRTTGGSSASESLRSIKPPPFGSGRTAVAYRPDTQSRRRRSDPSRPQSWPALPPPNHKSALGTSAELRQLLPPSQPATQ